jgi:hypothetical protein
MRNSYRRGWIMPKESSLLVTAATTALFIVVNYLLFYLF